jgi:ATP-dependent Lon protease
MAAQDTEQSGRAPEEQQEARVLPEALAVVPLRDTIVFPGMVVPLMVSRQKSLNAINDALVGQLPVGLLTQMSRETEEPSFDDLYKVGVGSRILKMLKLPDGSVSIIVQGLHRFRVTEPVSEDPFLKAKIETLAETTEETKEVEALAKNASAMFQKIAGSSPNVSEDAVVTLINITDPGKLADFIAANLNISVEEKEGILEETSVRERLKEVNTLLHRESEFADLQSKIQQQIQSEMGKTQREMFLRQQLRAIQKELGEGDERTVEIAELKERIEKAKMPEAALKAAEHELDRLEKMPPSAPEYTVARTYIDWLISLPWSVATEDTLDVRAARKKLDEDHYDLEKVKERVLEFLAVRKLKKDTKGPILCFVGPPGVGKTSLGKSIARTLGRKFVRISLGGIRDEAEIRGHRRTYVGALPGRIIQGIKRAGSNNPVFMLDEVDKIGADFRGDPSSALLEVLDPEQNFSFSDHYIEVPFDLSKVMFICTANIMDPVPDALRDRMEVLELPGYIEEDKLEIAKKYLIPRQLEQHGLTKKNLTFEKEAISRIIRDYTREAGLRNLEREIANICRKVATSIARGSAKKRRIAVRSLHSLLGPTRFFSEVAERTSEPGVATALAWTRAGGEILFVESSQMPGKGALTLTGKLGDVMKESAQAALTLIRSRAKKLGVPEDFYKRLDLHVHVPAGSIPKDGPSAGVAILASLASLLTGKPVRSDVGMTGEITLRGKVLPIGGVKEKVLAAHRAGIRTVILPDRNKKDLEEIPARVKKELSFKFAKNVDQVLRTALRADGDTPRRRARA